MTNEEKLKILMQIAVENGWNVKLHSELTGAVLFYICKKLPDSWVNITIDEIKNKNLRLQIKDHKLIYYSETFDEEWSVTDNDWFSEICLDNLITSFEEGEVSFIEALHFAYWCDKKMCSPYKDLLPFDSHYMRDVLVYNYLFKKDTLNDKIIMRPTSQKLDWLFDVFKHLL